MPTGLTADGSYQAGARRTMDLTAQDAWRNWAEAQGLGRWLSQARTALKEGEETTLADGTHVLAVRVRPPSLLRIRLSRADWPHPRTAQLRVLAAARGSTVALHMEGLPSAESRAEYIERWSAALTGASRPSRHAASSTSSKKAAVGPKANSSKKSAATNKPALAKTAVAAKKPALAKTAAAAKKPALPKTASATNKPALAKKAAAAKKPALAKTASATNKPALAKTAAATNKPALVKKALSKKSSAAKSRPARKAVAKKSSAR